MTNQDKEQKGEIRNIYIYNPIQSNYYISQGVMIKEVGIHPITKKPWYKFGFKESYDVYSEWCNRNKTRNN